MAAHVWVDWSWPITVVAQLINHINIYMRRPIHRDYSKLMPPMHQGRQARKKSKTTVLLIVSCK